MGLIDDLANMTTEEVKKQLNSAWNTLQKKRNERTAVINKMNEIETQYKNVCDLEDEYEKIHQSMKKTIEKNRVFEGEQKKKIIDREGMALICESKKYLDSIDKVKDNLLSMKKELNRKSGLLLSGVTSAQNLYDTIRSFLN